MNVSLFIALRYLSPLRPGTFRRALGTILSVGLSLAPLIVVLQVSDGMIQGITNRILEVGTYHAQVWGPGSWREAAPDSLITKLREIPGVVSVTEERQGVGIAYVEGLNAGVTLRSIPPDLWNSDEGFREYMRVLQGSFDLSDPRNAVVGSELASKLNLRIGDTIRVVTPYSMEGESMLSRVSTFTVAGIVSSGYQELDKLWFFISSQRGRILSPQASRKFWGIKVRDPFGDLQPIIGSIHQVLPRTYRVYTWEELESSRYLSFQTTRYLLIFIMGLIFVVASINISSTLVLLQIEKKEELAMLKSMGISSAQIVRLFYYLGAVIGILGVVVGVGIGLAIAVSINEVIRGIEWVLNLRILNPQFYLERIPLVLKLPEVLGASVFALLLSVLASVLPARAAGKRKPLEILVKQ